mgnify:CR=1 FL=1
MGPLCVCVCVCVYACVCVCVCACVCVCVGEQKEDHAPASSRFGAISQAAMPPNHGSFSTRWAMPSSQRLAFYHEVLCHAFRHGRVSDLPTLFARRPPSYALWSVMGALQLACGRRGHDGGEAHRTDNATATGDGGGGKPSSQPSPASAFPPVFCGDDSYEATSRKAGGNVPLSAVTPHVEELIAHAEEEMEELAAFWARTGSKAARGQLLRGWGGS